MTTTDQFNVTAAFDHPAGYTTGDTMTLTITGSDVVTTIEDLVVTIGLQATDGATGSITATVPLTKVMEDSVVITGVTDTEGRAWTVASGGLSATATA